MKTFKIVEKPHILNFTILTILSIQFIRAKYIYNVVQHISQTFSFCWTEILYQLHNSPLSNWGDGEP